MRRKLVLAGSLIILVLLGSAWLLGRGNPYYLFGSVVKKGEGTIKDLKENKGVISERGLLELEADARGLAQTLKFITPVTFKDLAKDYLKEDHYKKFSNSAFVIRYREKTFLVSAGHVFTDNSPQEKPFFYINDVSIPLAALPEVSEVLDIAALDVTAVYPDRQAAGKLQISSSDLVPRKTPLVAVCNPYHFSVPVRTGFFGGLMGGETGQNLFKRSYMELNFAGVGIQDGCSGSPVVDFAGKIRGLIIRATPNGQLGIAVPAQIIAFFLDKKFFE